MSDVRVARSEVELVADVLHLLQAAGAIERKWKPEALCREVGCSLKDLALARHRAERHGLDALRARPDEVAADPIVIPGEGAEPCPDPAAHEPKPRAAREGHSGERRCVRCDEWLPVEQFDRRDPGDPRPAKMCRICAGEFERDHFVAVKKAKPLHQVIAFFTATRGDAYVGRVCGKCGEPLVLGQCITLQSEPVHAKCPKVRR